MPEVSRDLVEARLQAFWSAALLRAGEGASLAEGARRLSALLAELGFKGNKGSPYSPDSIAHWPAGRRLPDSVVMVAVALALDMSVDQYIYGRSIEQPGGDLVERVEKLEEIQDFLQAWLTRDPEFGAELKRLAARRGSVGLG